VAVFPAEQAVTNRLKPISMMKVCFMMSNLRGVLGLIIQLSGKSYLVHGRVFA
jgi:hypothetical protein